MPPGTKELFDHYTVVCSLFQLQERGLWMATSGGQGVGNTVTYPKCQQLLDGVLHSLLNLNYALDSPDRLKKAKKIISSRLQEIIDSLEETNLAAAEEFAALLEAFGRADIPAQCNSAVVSAMNTARQTAHSFFQASNWKHTKSRLKTRDAKNWRLEYVIHPGDNSPMHYHNAEIRLRFGPSCGYSFYWLWPMAFMHEFCSHVYGEDNNLSHLRFTEGWLTYAAAHYFDEAVIRKRCSGLPTGPEANFLGKVRGTLNPNALEAWDQASSFHAWSSQNHPTCFQDLIFQLAAFQPNAERDINWPDEFLDRLEYTAALRPAELMALIGKSERKYKGKKRVCAQKLMPLLSERPRPRRIASIMAD